MPAHTENIAVVVLVTLSDRPDLHKSRTIPSLLCQVRKWDSLYVVDDREVIRDQIGGSLAAADLPSATFLPNMKSKGAAGAWNTGIEIISKRFNEAWVAILDDDDVWEPEHLERCCRFATPGLDAVISGIAVEGIEYQSGYFNDPLIRSDFLSGNPGWQGSNTFVRLSRLNQIGGFDESLPCTHDRDLALRLMALKGFRITRTGCRTVWYRIDQNVSAYSRKGNPVKLAGLRAFLEKYRDEMDIEVQRLFFERANNLFGFCRDQFFK